MIYGDGGSTYTKILYPDGQIKIIPTPQMLADPNNRFDLATGHAAKNRSRRFVNELIALVHGTLSQVSAKDFTVVDIGSRDTKYAVVRNRRATDLDWNTSCGGNMGFTLELLGKYYAIDYDRLQPSERKTPATCGLLAVEKVFDEINHGSSPEDAVAMFINGLCFNIHRFCQSPQVLYLAGGLTENNCFVRTMSRYCEVKTLGRDILLRGLVAISK